MLGNSKRIYNTGGLERNLKEIFRFLCSVFVQPFVYFQEKIMHKSYLNSVAEKYSCGSYQSLE